MARVPNPIRLSIWWIGRVLARVGLIGLERARRTADLAWPRIVTGLARMSKSAVDVAMVGIAVGPAAIAGVGFATPYWGLAFTVGGGVAGGTIALVSQRFGAEAYDQLGQAVRSSVVLVLALTLPITAVFWYYPHALISLVSNDPEAIAYGAAYLQLVGLGIPFAGLNLIGSRTFVGMDDAWTPMVVRAGGAGANILLNAVLIFGLDMGVVGAALGTVLANVVVTAAFAAGLGAGRLPRMGAFPTSVDPAGRYLHGETLRDLTTIGLPVLGTRFVWTVAEFPMLAIVDVFGQDTVAAYVIARRIWGLMNTPGWGFGLAASSLVGQELGTGSEDRAETYGREIVRFSVATYLVAAGVVAVFAEPIVLGFADDPADLSVPIAVSLVHAACLAVLFQGVSTTAAGALEASGDTRWPFYSQLLGMFGLAIPLAYLGAVGLAVPSPGTVPIVGVVVPGVTIPPLGLWGLYLAFLAETAVPAVINYSRFATGRWKVISRDYRPEPSEADD
ncbi:MATE family efflux transporter [Natrarchaeobaculum sulfurireducens]|uniref:Multidrug-efflux transporter n=1 Tax=Natrarchaeobaculum sulfurireducens TaxID=2044521 RepID=A0A346PGR6_9EURY|nr:MATE family efflux transporter [Natrarchaeobaculum sulfurireducens]AXR78711.1 Na+-driven multidrug efflux pump [Natrarchaeobaculum sulfurireducens]